MKKTIAAVAALGVLAPAALASSGTLKVSPSTVQAGTKLKLSGHAPCSTVTLAASGRPAAFKTVTVKTDSHHNYSKKVTVPSSTSSGPYRAAARCGKTKFAGAKFTVNGGPGFY